MSDSRCSRWEWIAGLSHDGRDEPSPASCHRGCGELIVKDATNLMVSSVRSPLPQKFVVHEGGDAVADALGI